MLSKASGLYHVILFDIPLWITIALLFITPHTALSLEVLQTKSNGFSVSRSISYSAISNRTDGNKTCASYLGQVSNQISKTVPPAWPWQIYKSAPFNPPELEIITNGEPLAPGLLFISPSGPTSVSKEHGVLIMTDTGQLVWNGPAVIANNFRVASYEGNDILTYWTGTDGSAANGGHGYGNITFLDSSYNEILVLCPKFGLVTPDNIEYQCEGDLHESFVTDRNTILVTAYNATETDLSPLGGPTNGWVFDSLFFELDPKTGNILFSWSALEHVPITGTKRPLAGTGYNQSLPFDWFHINSVVNIGDTYLVNSRHLWAVYHVTSLGEIAFTLQGEDGGDFGPLPTNGHFVSPIQHFIT